MSPSDALTAGLYALPALVWGVFTRQLLIHRRVRPEPSALFGPAVAATTLITLHSAVHVVEAFVPAGAGTASVFAAARHTTLLAAAAAGRHALRAMQLPESPPGRRWLAVNYGLLLAFAVPALALLAVPRAPAAWAGVEETLVWVGMAVFVVLCRQQAVRMSRPSSVWGPEHAGEVTQHDLQFVGWGFVASAAICVGVAALAGLGSGLSVLEVGMGLAIAVPIVVNGLGFALPELLASVALLGAATAVVLGHAAALANTAPAWHPLVHLAAVLALALLIVPGQARLRLLIQRLVLRRSVRQQVELLGFLQHLSPELGTQECCRRALAELVRVRRVPGAAVILRDGASIAHGDFDLAPLLAAWPRGPEADALPPRSFGTDELRRLPLSLRRALTEANVGLGAAPILSPRRRWGHLFMNTGMLRGNFRPEEIETFEAFCGQLALVLDAAELLERAVAVERSLAHAEKLAAIGETAARIAHDIRNPVTAARSLAQQLARGSAAPADREAAEVILQEMERVERQVASLLRFSRREEFCFEPLDLGSLARAALDPLRPRLEAAGVLVELDAPAGIVARADGEKMRQVIVNLVENALDALREAAGPRRLTVAVSGEDGVARLRVGDSGPGVPADALPRLFEPFFSLKPAGTGLGLAIAKRTVDAHGGRITAESPAGAGLQVDLEVPLARAA